MELPNEVADVFDSYPTWARRLLKRIRKIAETVAKEQYGCAVEETLKWGEPSYLVHGGSSVRLAWDEKRADTIGVYFNCNSKLVETFRQLFDDTFRFEGNRAILFSQDDALPEAELKECIALAFSYHKVKHLPLLGAKNN